MTFDIREILAAKKACRQALATRDILEKLRMLDAMRERAITLRAGAQWERSAHTGEGAPQKGSEPDV